MRSIAPNGHWAGGCAARASAERRPRRWAKRVGALTLGAALVVPALASAESGEPEGAAVRQAATEFEQGLAAYDEARYDVAGDHFEKADSLAPNPEALRASLTARDKAGQAARAATLAAQAQRRYPKDGKLQALARDVLGRRGGDLHRVKVTCSQPCAPAIDGSAVSGPGARELTVYVEPGKRELGVSFLGGGGEAEPQTLVARAGGQNSLHFIARSAEAAPAPPSATREPAREPPPDEQGEGAPAAEPTAPAGDGSGQAEPEPTADEPLVGWSPVVFFVALGSTAVLGGVTIWSGVDTLNNPGPDAVRAACAGLGSSCPEYQEGLDKELRTNVLIGVTAGVAALTGIVGLFLTDWGSADEDGKGTAVRFEPSRGDAAGLTVRF